MFNKNAMERELEKGQIKRDNRLFLTYIVAAVFLGMIIVNPIGLIVGIIVYFIEKNKAFITAISSLILGIILLFINSIIMKISVIQAIKSYFFNFVEFKSGKGKIDFLSDYFLNGMCGTFFLFFGLAVLLGMYGAYWYSSYSNREEARIKSRKRFDASGNETKFIDYSKSSISNLKESVVKSRKEVTHKDVNGIYMGLNGLKKVIITDK
jgi:hypothetical protein